jgi:DNA-binding response OmpR family regulator
MRIIKASSSNQAQAGLGRMHGGRHRYRYLRPVPGTERPDGDAVQIAPGVGESLRVGHLDSDSGLLRVTAKRLERLGSSHIVLAPTVSPELALAAGVNALVVDVAILGLRRWDWLQRVRRLEPGLCLIVCTASATVAERVRGLRLGVDDWLTKPCHPEELIARVEGVVCSRASAERRHDMPPVVAGELEIRRTERQAFVAGRSLRLTAREFQVLELLASYEGCILEREFIYQRVWGYDMNRGDRSVDVFVRKVRHKLELASPAWGYVHTHFKVGYRFAAEYGEDLAPFVEPLAA